MSAILAAIKPHRVKKSLTIRADLRSHLEAERNKSKVVNSALELYFAHKKYMADIEAQRLHQMAIEGLQSAKDDTLIVMEDKDRESLDTIEQFLYRIAS